VTLGELTAGGWAALRAPYWLRPERLPALLAIPPVDPRTPVSEPSTETIRAARGILHRLGKLPGGVWRGTCLYRSAAEVLIRRDRGQPARLQIGARRAGEEIGAHAWVEVDGRPVGPDATEAQHYSVLG
jgi:hypothetical protein